MEIPRAAIKIAAKERLKGNWGGPISVVLIIFAFNILISLPGTRNRDYAFFTNIASLFISGALQYGGSSFFLAFVKTPGQEQIASVLDGFKHYGRSLGMYLWMMLWIVLWALLLVIPGIIKAFAYSMSFYIIAENPAVKVTDALKISMKMTNGFKGDIFVFMLSFLGWMLLCILTLGIGFIWLFPYLFTSFTGLYLKLKENALQTGACTAADFEGAPRAQSAS
jgi:uncharacterized membrane protein